MWRPAVLLVVLCLIRPDAALARGPAAAQIHQALAHWIRAVGSGQGETPIVALYDPGAILLATFDPQPLTTQGAIAAYFHKLTQNPHLKATIDREKIVVFGNGAADTGLYTFSYTKDGKDVRVPARFTFVYRRTAKGWLIVSHHSSVLPQAH